MSNASTPRVVHVCAPGSLYVVNHPLPRPLLTDLFAPDPVEAAAAEEADAPARRPPAAEIARRGHRPAAAARPRRHADADDRLGPARLADPLGTARHRQDHRRPPPRRRDELPLPADLRRVLRRRRPQEGVRGRPDRAHAGPPDAALRRRNPPLQPRPAGQLPAGDGGRHRRPRRRHHREPELRAQRGAPVSRSQVLVLPVASGRRSWRSSPPAPRRCWARPCRSTRPPAPRSTTLADGDGRALLGLVEEVFAVGQAGRDPRHRGDAQGRAAPRADLRQEAGRPLQPDLGAAQDGPRLRSRRRALLSRPHARGRRGPDVPRPPPDPHVDRRHRPRRSAGAAAGDRRPRRLPHARHARRRAGAGAAHRLPRARAQIERRLHRLQGRDRTSPRRPARRCRRRSSSMRRPR